MGLRSFFQCEYLLILSTISSRAVSMCALLFYLSPRAFLKARARIAARAPDRHPETRAESGATLLRVSTSSRNHRARAGRSRQREDRPTHNYPAFGGLMGAGLGWRERG